jgi:hypothetical protein
LVGAVHADIVEIRESRRNARPRIEARVNEDPLGATYMKREALTITRAKERNL